MRVWILDSHGMIYRPGFVGSVRRLFYVDFNPGLRSFGATVAGLLSDDLEFGSEGSSRSGQKFGQSTYIFYVRFDHFLPTVRGTAKIPV